ncbi:MAG TPA: MoaD/ThiS family protein [Pirellulales bacterium]|jgi:molybdopterin converting factor subunit 1|nr:MoaD/ThiS family protein [Pirellulales bacterium]
MKFRVQVFAAARDAIGADAIEVDVAEPPTVGELRRSMNAQFPALAHITPHLMFAVDADYADDRTPLHDGADVAAIPPVSGG